MSYSERFEESCTYILAGALGLTHPMVPPNMRLASWKRACVRAALRATREGAVSMSRVGTTFDVEGVKQRWRAASSGDRTIDSSEMEASLEKIHRADLETMTDAMLELIREGARFTSRARALAFRACGESLSSENSALSDLDRVIMRTWLGETGPIDNSSAGSIRHKVKLAIASAEFPEVVTSYLTARLLEARRHLESRPGAGAAIAQRIKEVMDEFRLEGEGRPQIPIHPSQFMAASGTIDHATEPGGYYSPPGEVRSDFVGLLNDLIADGRLEKRDAEFLIGYFERWHPEPGPLAGFLSRKAQRRNKYDEKELRDFERALGELPASIVEEGARERLQGWIGDLRSAGRASARKSLSSQLQSTLQLPYSPDPGAPHAAVVPEGRFDYAKHGERSSEITAVATNKDLTADAKIEALYRIATEAQERLVAAARQVDAEGTSYRPLEADIKRVISESELHGSSYSSGRSSRGGALLLGLLGFSGGSASMSAGSSFSGSSAVYEIIGRQYSLGIALKDLNPRQQRTITEKFRAQLAPHIADLQHALSAIVHELGTAERKPENVAPAVRDLLAWACTTRFVAGYTEKEYMGPTLRTVDRRIDVIDRWVMPKLLGENR